PALLRAALVEYDRRDVLRVHVDDAEENQLEHGDDDREQQRRAIACHLRQLFTEHSREAIHREASTSLPRVSVNCTNTSSSVGAIAATVTSLVPISSRSCSTFSFVTRSSIRRCSVVPKIVAART